jgi:Leucine-rich repeat (LRR) protein
VTTSEIEELIARAKLEKLIEIEIDCQELKSLPESIGQLTNLRRITLFINELESLPESIGQLTNLEDLFLMGLNRSDSLPNSHTLASTTIN